MFDKEIILYREVKRALVHLHDLAYLRRHPLVEWLPPSLTISGDRGKALQGWLRESVECLKPATTLNEQAKEWRPYFILYWRYLEGLGIGQVLAKLSISEREFHRQQRKALAALVECLKVTREENQPPHVELEPIPRAKHFVGRQAELAHYRQQLEQDGFAIISGLAGVGKTSLGAELAGEWADHSLVIWFTFLRERNTNLEAVLEGLALALAALRQEAYWHFLQADRQRGSALRLDTHVRYLSNLLADKGFLLCFDNVELTSGNALVDSLFRDLQRGAQVGKLRLLVVSRQMPAFATGLSVSPLSSLSRADARLLLAAEGMPSLPEALFVQLYERTYGIPVFLKLFAAWLHGRELAGASLHKGTLGLLSEPETDQGWVQIETYVAQLMRQKDVRTYLLREVYSSLSVVEQRFVEIVSAFRLPFDEREEEMLHLLAAEGIEDTARTLDALVAKHLFTTNGAGIFYLHPLIRDYCYSRLVARPADKVRVHNRLAAYYEAGSDPLEAAYHFDRAGELARAATLLTENLQRLIDAGQGQAALRQLEQLTPRIARLSDMTLHFESTAAREQLYDLLGEREKQRSALQSMLALAAGLGDDRRLAMAHNRWSEFYCLIADFAAALGAAQAGLTAARAAGDQQAEVESLTDWGWALIRAGNYEMAQVQLGEALWLARVLGDRVREAIVLNDLGVVSQELQDYPAAERHYKEALAIWSALRDQHGTARSLNNLGLVRYMCGDYGIALDYFEQVLAVLRAIGHKLGEATALTNLGNIYLDLGRYESGQNYYKQSLAIDQALGDRRSETMDLFNLGILHCFSGNYLAAQDYCRQGLKVARSIDTRREIGYALTYLGMALEGAGDFPAAKESYTEGLAIRHEISQTALAIDSLAGLARVALAEGALGEAQNHTEEILTFLADHGPAGLDYPLIVYLTCVRILMACGEHGRAGQALQAGYNLLMERAAKISDLVLRESFLKNVPANHALLEAWKEADSSTSV